MFRSLTLFIYLTLIALFNTQYIAYSQELIINLSELSGQPITPNNILSFQIINPKAAVSVLLKGEISFEQNSETIKFEKKVKLNSGINTIAPSTIHITYTSNAIKELFNNQILPAGAYKYCITIINDPDNTVGELDRSLTEEVNECITEENNNSFLINLIDPADGNETYEYYPVLSWMVNSPIISQLNYRIRVAELRQGQDPENAIDRNNPYFQIKDHSYTFLNYPPSARRLKVLQDYVWSVDAYYKDIFMGKSETWRFKIIEDSLLPTISKDPSYIEVNLENGTNTIYAPGLLKLKFYEKEFKNEKLKIKLIDDKGVELKSITQDWDVVLGENRIILNFDESYNLKHRKQYQLVIETESKKIFQIKMMYINPSYL